MGIKTGRFDLWSSYTAKASFLPVKQSLIAKITTILQQAPIVANLAHRKGVARFVIGLLKARKVHFPAVAQHFNDQVKVASNQPRIEKLFRQTPLDYTVLALLLVSLLPRRGKLRLCLDRTAWNFGQCEVNILLVTVGSGELQWPLCWALLDNRSGNSNAADRIALLDFCLQVLGCERIGLVLGDREFVGQNWFGYLISKRLNFVVRLPKQHLLTDSHGREHAIATLGLAVGQSRSWRTCQVNGVWGQAVVTALDGGEFRFLFGSVSAPLLGQFYRLRWTIEQCFQNLKGRGFDLQSTHLRCYEKLKKLVGLVSLSYALCVSLGKYCAEKVQPIPVKKHGRKSRSLSRHGLDVLQELLRPTTSVQTEWEERFALLERWILSQIAYLQ